MKQVQQHPDGNVYVRVDDLLYADTPENFANDFGYALPWLPVGFTERIYDQGRRHTLAGTNESGTFVDGGEMPWPLGDKAILEIGIGLNAQSARLAAQAKAKTSLAPTLDMGGTTAQIIGS